MKTNPTAVRDHIAQLDRQQQHYFFERITNPNAFDTLVAAGAFDAITPPETIDGQVLHYTWPPTLYLRNVVAQIPQRVADLIAPLETQNERVLYDLADLVAKMPAEQQEQMIASLVRWLDFDHVEWMASTYVDILASLAANERIAPALALAARLFRIKAHEPESIGGFFRQRDAVAEIGDDYLSSAVEQILSNMRPPAKIVFLNFIAGRLDEALQIEASAKGQNDDYSAIWAHDLSEPPLGSGVKEALTYHLHRGLTEMLADRSASLDDALAILSAFHWAVFTRIRYSLITRFGSLPERAAVTSERQFMAAYKAERERDALLQKTYPELSQEQKTNVVAAMRRAIHNKRRVRSFLKDEVSPDELEQAVERYRRRLLVKRFRPISDALEGPLLDEYHQLDTEFPLDPREQHGGIQTWVGPETPLSQSELEALDTAALFGYVETWRPPQENFFAPSAEGLGQTIEPIVEQRYREILQHVDRLLEWQGVYVRSVISGLRRSIARPDFDTDAFLRLLTYCRNYRHDDELVNRDLPIRDASTEGWRSLAVTTSLSISDVMRSAAVTVERRQLVWETVAFLLTDPDPTLEDEATFTRTEPWNRALNSVRGSAMLAVFDFARWIYRASGGDAQPIEARSLAPEALEALEAHLVPEIDASPTIRSAYGQNFISIYAISRTWTMPAIPRIFGEPPELSESEFDAWSTYLALNNVYDETFELLRPYYHASVTSLTPRLAREPVVRGLATHMMRAYARGLTTFDEPQSIIAAFLAHTSPATLGMAVLAAGNSLQTGDISRAIWDRMERLYDALLARFANHTAKEAHEALGAFGLWVLAPTVDRAWAIDALIRTLDRTHGQLHFRHRVLTFLAEMSTDDPYPPIRVLFAMTSEGAPLRFAIDAAFGAILSNAVAAGGQAREVGAAVDERLASIGIHRFHELFRASP